MRTEIGKELAALQRMTPARLREKYAGVFGEATVTKNRTWRSAGSRGGSRYWPRATSLSAAASERQSWPGTPTCGSSHRVRRPRLWSSRRGRGRDGRASRAEG
jgi:hypothetical protein